jgi:methyl-accepting chemotaxis protein
MALRIRIAPAILVPMAVTLLGVVGLVLFLSAQSNLRTVESTLSGQQVKMISVLAEQFAGAIRFNKLEPVQQALAGYEADPDFGVVAAGAVDTQGGTLLAFGADSARAERAAAIADEAVKTGGLVSRVENDVHYAAYPAYFGKELALTGAFAMAWDLSIHRDDIIAQQAMNGAIGLAIAAGAIVALGFFIMRHVTAPMARLTRSASALAEGNLEVELQGAARRDELGDLARSVEVFRNNSLKVRQMTEADVQRVLADQEARRAMMLQLRDSFGEVVGAAVSGNLSARVAADFADAELNGLAGSVNMLLETVDRSIGETGAVLAALADADLSQRINGEYQGSFARLKDSTNTVAEKLTDIVAQLKKTSFDLKTATGEILSGANDLSERTTKQAATIEETSAAMEQLATTVMANAQRAAGASENAGQVTAAAEEGGKVMLSANEAMGRITDSSSKISNIIGLIDDIAFQTNLLALNASVEAARAGDAGKGFAVVAVEVRRLAQSAASASSEVKALIEQSSGEVRTGSKLVADAAAKLESMLVAVRGNREQLEGIARDSREQASAIEEVNTAVRQMDEMTQHNAALVEETNAAIEQTESQASELDRIVAVFTLGAAEGGTAPAVSTTPSAPTGVKALQAKVKAAAKTYLTRGNTAMKSDDWAEF